MFDAQHAALESGLGATDLRITEDVLCGLPAETLDYARSGHGTGRATSGDVGGRAVLHTDDTTFVATLTVHNADPDDPTYQRDAQTILTGFQMLPPSDA